MEYSIGGHPVKLANLTISNYRALKDVSIPLSHFVCLIGENNTGKSSILQVLTLFFSGTALSKTNFYDPSKPIDIEMTFQDIQSTDLDRLAEEHRTKVEAILENNQLILVRHYDLEGKSSLKYKTLKPKEERFSDDAIETLLKGGRSGSTLKTKVIGVFPELTDTIDTTMNQSVIKEKINELAASLPVDQKSLVNCALPTGIDNSIRPILPEPLYIPAVKDLSDDIKTKESTPFGKILSILLRAIESKLPETKDVFKDLDIKLNIHKNTDGTIDDNRLNEVKLIEHTIESYIKESFSDVNIRIDIPPPDFKTIFSSSQIYANDGVDGLIDTKGDGLRRAVVFSILRTYVHLKSIMVPESDEVLNPNNNSSTSPDYLLLFEEPELFLHPKGQNLLFDALRVFSKSNHVVVTTHSPLFLGPGATETFIKLVKNRDASQALPPYSIAQIVDLTDMKEKEQFQLICFENNNAAFFADMVVLVEGDSDYILFPHIAKTLNEEWDIKKLPVYFARISGKGNIARYTEFFKRFNVRVPVISDLDILLDGFKHLSTKDGVKQARGILIQAIDKQITNEKIKSDCTADEAKNAQGSGELKSLWKKVKDNSIAYRNGDATWEDLNLAMEEFLAWQNKSSRLNVLETCKDSEFLKLKWVLFHMLRQSDVYVLEKGAIESYYPESITGSDKTSLALDFCQKVKSRDEVLSCCGEQTIIDDDNTFSKKEFELIFGSIFRT
jgi:putative ATP-dependent endonuclease of the OLD family